MFLFRKFPLFTDYIFLHPDKNEGEMLTFSSDIDKIGIEWDVAIKNGSYIDVISDPIEITKEPYGTFSVVKVKADVATDYHTIIREFWIPIICVKKVEKQDRS